MTIRKYTDFIIRFRWPIIIIAPLVVLVFSVGLKDLGFEGSYRVWFSEDSAILRDYDHFRKTFGAGNMVLISFTDENGIFTKKALKTIERITGKLWKTKYIARVDSITNYQYVHTGGDDPDDIIVDDFIGNIDGMSEQELKEREKIAVEDPRTRNLTISPDGKSTTIFARLVPLPEEDRNINFEIRSLVEDIIKEESAKTGYEFYLNGAPIIQTEFINMASHDFALYAPLVAFMVLVLLLVALRKLSGAFLPFLVVLFTLAIVLAVQAMMGYRLNNFTANLPVFVIAIGIADAMHIYWVWLHARRQGKDNYEALHVSINKNLFPAFLTSITTFAGFISLASSRVIPVRTLGIATACAAILAFLLSAGFIPAMLAVLKVKVKAEDDTNPDMEHTSALAKKYSSFIIEHDKKIMAVSLAVALLFAVGLFKVRVDNNIIKYFAEDTRIRKAVNFLEDRITGPVTYEVILDSGRENGIKEPGFLRTVDRFYGDFQREFRGLRHIGSLLDVIKRFNMVMHGDNDVFNVVPDDKNLIAQYLLLYALSLPQGMEINDRVDITERFFRLTASVNSMDTSEYLKMIRWIEGWWAGTPYSASVNGQDAMFAYMFKNVTDTIIYSITMAFVMVTVVMLIAFRSFKILIISILPNILPIVLVVGLMGWSGMYIDLGVAVSGAIILGVAVDDTIHILVKYLEARKRGKEMKEALEYMITFSGAAIIFTTVILSGSFSVLYFSDFMPTSHFSIVTVSALVIALVADMFMLPALLSIFDKRRMLESVISGKQA
ncbi:MAG: MMPL family transporter [Nitrospirota bacterium]|nr:MMPL family transporter [Nitrospirota bacterium]